MTIEFVEGHGIQPGDPVRLRGIDVGVVEHVVLDAALEKVLVTAKLMRESSRLAREGTLFWIERPQVGLGAVRGLDTVVGPKYIGVQPGPATVRDRTALSAWNRRDRWSATASECSRCISGRAMGSALDRWFVFVACRWVKSWTWDCRPDGAEVLLQLELVQGAAGLAREGSLFWIERPLWACWLFAVWTRWSRDRFSLSVRVRPMVYLWTNWSGLETPPAESDAVGGIRDHPGKRHAAWAAGGITRALSWCQHWPRGARGSGQRCGERRDAGLHRAGIS